MLCSVCGKTPVDEGAAFIAGSASVLGDVVLGPGSSVWYGAVLRADEGSIRVGARSNIQDNAVLHCDPGLAVTLGEDVTVGHSAVVHGCTVGDGAMIGMHATLLNRCVVGKGAIVGAGALVPEGMVIPDGSVAVGVPARVIKDASPEQKAFTLHNAQAYQELGRLHAEKQDERNKFGGN